MVQGTLDGMHWIDVHAVRNSNHFREIGQRYHAAFPATDFFTGIRITQTGTNTMNYHNFRVAKLEFFGRVRDVEEGAPVPEHVAMEERSPSRLARDEPRRGPPSIARLHEARIWSSSSDDLLL
jgi:hypothetical protein